MRSPGFRDRWDLDVVRSGRGRWTLAAFVAVLVGFISLSILVPRFAESRVAARLEPLGLAWKAGGRSLRFAGLGFQDVSIESKSATRPIARIGELDVDLSWLRALWNPRAAIEAVRVSGVDVDISLDDLVRMRSAPREAASPTGAGRQESAQAKAFPPVELVNAKLRLRDADGLLLLAALKRFALTGGAWEIELERFELGGNSAERAAFQDARAAGPWTGKRPQLAQGRVESAVLVWSSLEGEEGARDRPRLVRRIANARKALRGTQENETEPATSEPRASLWTSDARIALRKARVLEGPGTQGVPILQQLNVDLLAEGESSIRVKGDGATPTGGSMFWDLHVAPGDAKVEGQVALRDVPLALFAPVLPKLPFHGLERTRVGANLAITGRGLESASVRGELSIADLGFESERIARSPVGPVSFTARGQATWTPARRELSELRGEVQSGLVRLLVTGALAWPRGGYRIDLRAELPKAKCANVLAVVPAGLLDDLAAIELEGDFKAKLEAHVDSADLDTTKLDFDIVDKCKFVSLPEAMSIRHFEQPFTHRVLEPDGTMFEMETGPGTPAWTPIELISPFMIQAVVAHEDGRFFHHRGFAEVEIGNALARNLKAGAFKFGASTITMQLVKNVFLHRDKLLSRKFQEALIVWWLEQQVDKKWILELYLNVIEYGTGIYGIRNAALHYFGTLPIHLTPAQAAFLATILPNPKSYDEQYAKGTITSSTKSRVASFLQHMRSRDRIDDEALAYGLEELQNFRFYRPDEPPPVPPQVRGAAQAPPFQLGAIEGWSTFDPATTKVEDGSFGNGM